MSCHEVSLWMGKQPFWGFLVSVTPEVQSILPSAIWPSR